MQTPVKIIKSSDNYYILDRVMKKIVSYSNDWTFIKSYNFSQNKGDQVPIDMTMNKQNNLFILTNTDIIELTKGFEVVNSFNLNKINSDIKAVSGISSYENDFIFISDIHNNKVYIINQSGAFIKAIGEIGNGYWQYQNPSYLTVNKENLWISDNSNHRFIKYKIEKNKKDSLKDKDKKAVDAKKDNLTTKLIGYE